jgi:hypothetical protein
VEGDDHDEAYTTIAWSGLLSREISSSQGPRRSHTSKATCAAPLMRGADALPRSKTPLRAKGTRRNLGDLAWPAVASAIPGHDRKSRRRSCRGTGEESDGCIVPVKPRTKPSGVGGGECGGKAAGRREGERQRMLRTLRRALHATEAASLRIEAGRTVTVPNDDRV